MKQAPYDHGHRVERVRLRFAFAALEAAVPASDAAGTRYERHGMAALDSER